MYQRMAKGDENRQQAAGRLGRNNALWGKWWSLTKAHVKWKRTEEMMGHAYGEWGSSGT